MDLTLFLLGAAVIMVNMIGIGFWMLRYLDGEVDGDIATIFCLLHVVCIFIVIV